MENPASAETPGGEGAGAGEALPVFGFGFNLPLVSREWKTGSNSSYNCTPFLHSLLTKGKLRVSGCRDQGFGPLICEVVGTRVVVFGSPSSLGSLSLSPLSCRTQDFEYTSPDNQNAAYGSSRFHNGGLWWKLNWNYLNLLIAGLLMRTYKKT